jgi:hypothetical protein
VDATQSNPNPIQTLTNGRFTFYAKSGWYDLMVSGQGITTYSYRIFIFDGVVTAAVPSGPASNDLYGNYPGPYVRGLLGISLPYPNQPPGNDQGPFYSTASGRWIWKTYPTAYVPGPASGDVDGTYPTLRVIGIRSIPIVGPPPTDGQNLVYRTASSGYIHESPSIPPAPVEHEKVTFIACIGVPCGIGSNITNPFIWTSTAGAVQECFIAARTPPQGSNLVIDLLKNGTSIFGINKLQLTPSGGVESRTISVPSVKFDVFTMNITAVGNLVRGQDVTVTCRSEITTP